MIPFGVSGKTSRAAAAIFSSGMRPVPKVSTMTETGSATPIAYAIGVADPVSLLVDTQGTSKVDESKITEAVREIFPLTPKGLIEYLNLRRPMYKKTAAYGHFGRNEPEFNWERTDKAEALRSLTKKSA